MEVGVGFGEGGDGFAGEQLCAAVGEEMPALLVEVDEPLFVQIVVAGVFGSVGEIGTIGADAGGDEGALTAVLIVFVAPKLVAGLAGKIDGELDEVDRFGVAETVGDEPLNGGLVAGGDEAVCSGVEVVEVDLADEVGLFLQELGGPEGGVE